MSVTPEQIAAQEKLAAEKIADAQAAKLHVTTEATRIAKEAIAAADAAKMAKADADAKVISDTEKLKQRAKNPLLNMDLGDVPEELREHIKELRKENAAQRIKLKESGEDAERERVNDAVKKAIEDHDAKIQQATKDRDAVADKRIINAEVRSAAAALGIQDVDALKLLDTSKLKINQETGDVDGVAALLDEFKTAKPYLFKAVAVDTSQSRRAPTKGDPKAFDARTATKEELAADAKARGFKLKTH
jgi:hypothetical protein